MKITKYNNKEDMGFLPSLPPTTPIPLCFQPPNGTAASIDPWQFTQTVPTCITKTIY